MTPSAHEFILRCEQQGVGAADWAADLRPMEGMEPALLSPSGILKRLGAIDPVGHLRRRIELSRDLPGMVACVQEMATLFSTRTAEGSDGGAIPYAIQCQLNCKLISKARRLLTPPSDSTNRDPAGESADAVEVPTPDVEDTNTPGKIIPLTSEERDQFKDVVSGALALFKSTLHSVSSATGTQQPILKWCRFSSWCSAHDLIHAADLAAIQGLDERRNVEMVSQLSQLETVMKLKTLREGTEEELRALVEELWQNGEGKYLQPYSLDVLSCLATAASAEQVSQGLKSLIADRLVKTQLFFSNPENGKTTERIQLPRRALRFVNEQRAKQQHAITANQRIAAEACPVDSIE
ncbi:unnamed protein product [Phytomonas sp. Hart1]|nr:unnamed protein product [Phytomonas sp. Hart1]|eukprot:CCW69928.1 unnamed protein product [Phytomonas sp. isolate Hart1]